MDGYTVYKHMQSHKKELPDIHIHAFFRGNSYASLKANTTVLEYLKMLKEVRNKESTWHIC